MRTKRVFTLVTIAVGVCIGLLLWVTGVTRSQEGAWAPPVRVTTTPGSSYGPRLTVDSQGTVHMVWVDWVDLVAHPPYLLYANKPAGGNWTSYEYVPGAPYVYSAAAAMGPDDTLHIVWYYNTGVRYIHRHSNGNWSTIETVASKGTSSDISVGPDNTAHVVWVEYGTGGNGIVYYRSRSSAGTWSSSISLYSATSTGSPLIAAGSDNTIHVIITKTGAGERNQYTYKTSLTGWVPAEDLPFDTTIWTVEQLAVDSTGTLSLVWGEMDWVENHNHLCYASKSPGGWSEVTQLAVEGYPINAAVAGDSHGNVHVAWKVKNLEQADHVLRYRQKVGPVGWGETLTGSMDGTWLTISEDLSVAASPDNYQSVAWDTGPVYTPYDPNDGRGDIYGSEMQVDPQVSTIVTTAGGSLAPLAGDIHLNFPAGSVITDTRVTLKPGGARPTQPLVAGLIFDLTAKRVSDGAPVTSFNLPYTLTVTYTPTSIGSAIESTLHVYSWNGNQWIGEAGTLDMAANRLVVHPNHMTYFALLGETIRIFLPVMVK